MAKSKKPALVARRLDAPVRPPARTVPSGVVIDELRREIRMYHESFAEVDGEVRDNDALHTITCLRAAIEIIERSNTSFSGRRPASGSTSTGSACWDAKGGQ